MQAIARKHEAELRFEYGEVIGEIVPVDSDYFSIMAEAMEDRVGYLLAVLDVSRARSKYKRLTAPQTEGTTGVAKEEAIQRVRLAKRA